MLIIEYVAMSWSLIYAGGFTMSNVFIIKDWGLPPLILTCQRHVFALAIHLSALSIGEAVVYDDGHCYVIAMLEWRPWFCIVLCFMDNCTLEMLLLRNFWVCDFSCHVSYIFYAVILHSAYSMISWLFRFCLWMHGSLQPLTLILVTCQFCNRSAILLTFGTLATCKVSCPNIAILKIGPYLRNRCP